MKTKLTLTVDDKIVIKMKRDARTRGKSLSGYIEDLGGAQTSIPDRKQQAIKKLLAMLDKQNPTKSVNKKTAEKLRLKYLKKKHG